MPWDPKPQPPTPQAPPPQQAPAAQPAAPAAQNGPSMPSYSPVDGSQGNNGGAPQIKAEPGSEPGFQNVPQAHNYGAQGTNQLLAQQRAAQLLQAQFGSQANASLGAMQQRGIALPGQQRPQGLQLPGQNSQQATAAQQQQQQQAMQQQQYAQHMRNQQHAQQQPQVKIEGGQQNGQYQQPQNGQQSGVGYSQTDGAGDTLDEWNTLMAQRRMLSADDVAQNDRNMRDDVARLVRSLDHGLMVPLDQHQRHGKRSKVMAKGAKAVQSSSDALATIPQLDGEADIKEEDDEDAINSDLDSSDDEANKEEEDEEEIDSMLCTYDKVQRVKNKWKCVLKDGVLKANGKE